MKPRRALAERRVYRLATLLTGSPHAATQVIEQVVGDRVELGALDAAHLDRLTVLRSRELERGLERAEIAEAELSRDAARALVTLAGQQREAWVFRHVYRKEPRDAARAMDCSVTAYDRHVTAAEAALAGADPGADGPAVAEALRAYAGQLELPAFHRERIARRRHRRIALLALGAALAAAALYSIVVTLIG